jgi:hypothetical protein
MRQTTDGDIGAVTDRIDETRRKCLGSKTPAKIFAANMMEIEAAETYLRSRGKSPLTQRSPRPAHAQTSVDHQFRPWRPFGHCERSAGRHLTRARDRGLPERRRREPHVPIVLLSRQPAEPFGSATARLDS